MIYMSLFLTIHFIITISIFYQYFGYAKNTCNEDILFCIKNFRKNNEEVKKKCQKFFRNDCPCSDGNYTSCCDLVDNCLDYDEYCREKSSRLYMKKVCPYTCGFCERPDPVGVECFDKFDKCFERRHRCWYEEYSIMVTRRCSYTCGICTNKTELAKDCESPIYQDYMSVMCTDTCGYCSEDYTSSTLSINSEPTLKQNNTITTSKISTSIIINVPSSTTPTTFITPRITTITILPTTLKITPPIFIPPIYIPRTTRRIIITTRRPPIIRTNILTRTTPKRPRPTTRLIVRTTLPRRFRSNKRIFWK
uniref:ShKT domain-containing protein n=1 Tax=Strongyloides stercoralis TaxID=6248 RepID=A0A0K0DYM8_STRER